MSPVDSDVEDHRRRPGRPRRAGTDERILQATVDELACGVAEFTVGRVAARAGVSRSTIYRRWPTKIDLVASAVELHGRRTPEPDEHRAGLGPESLQGLVRLLCSPQGYSIAAHLALLQER